MTSGAVRIDESNRRARTLLAAVAIAVLAGCAAGQQSQAVQWIKEDEAQRQRLNDAGFPQYNGQS